MTDVFDITGYVSDKFGRKFGMMSATGLVVVFSLLSASVKGVNGNLHSMLAQLSAWRYGRSGSVRILLIVFNRPRFLLGIGIGADYSCGSAAANELSEEQGIAKNARHRWVILATSNLPIDASTWVAI